MVLYLLFFLLLDVNFKVVPLHDGRYVPFLLVHDTCHTKGPPHISFLAYVFFATYHNPSFHDVSSHLFGNITIRCCTIQIRITKNEETLDDEHAKLMSLRL